MSRKRLNGIAALAIVGAILTVAAVALVAAFALFYSIRPGFVAWFAQAACRATGCGDYAMATAGWAAWALTVAVVTTLVIVHRQAPRWLFFTLLLPGAVLIFLELMFGNYGHRSGRHEPLVHDLVAGFPGGPALDVGLTSGRWGVILLLPLEVIIVAATKSSPPALKWAWQLAQLSTPVVVLLASLGIALLAV